MFSCEPGRDGRDIWMGATSPRKEDIAGSGPQRMVRTVIMVIIIRPVSTVRGRNTNAMHAWVAANVVTWTGA